MRLRVLMVSIAFLAVVLGVGLGLHRKSTRLSAVGLPFRKEAIRLENQLLLVPGFPEGIFGLPLLDQVHWTNEVADAYERAASRPWVPGEPDPAKITCQCRYHAKMSLTRPGP